MPDADFEARLARISQSRQVQPPAPPHRATPAPCSYRERLSRALGVAAAAGISREAGFPPLLRGLAAMGVPVRPLHYASLASLFLIGFLLGMAVFGGVLWLVSAPDVGVPARGKIAGLARLGWPGVFAVATAVGLGLAAIIRIQALRAGLPRWRDL